MENKSICLAYGSKLNLPQMADRYQPNGGKGYKLVFRGPNGQAVATVEPEKGKDVPVLLFEITKDHESTLDRYEGWPYLNRKEKVKLAGKTVQAMLYVMNDGRPLGQPSLYYYSVIYDGYKAAGFDTDVLKKATEDSFESEDEENEGED